MEFLDRKGLEIILSRLESISNPNLNLEQYQTPASVASFMLFTAAMEKEIAGKIIADLGAGNGILAIGAKLLGADKVYAVEIDDNSVDVCKRNSSLLGVEIECIKGDISNFDKKVDTVIMNPPFGSRKEDADIPFLDWALKNSRTFYTILNGKSGNFPERYLEGRAEILWKISIPLELKKTYEFHRHERINMPSYILKARTCPKI